jgi:hypothetical protein
MTMRDARDKGQKETGLTLLRSERLLKENVAEEMRLHGEDGYHWTPSQ